MIRTHGDYHLGQTLVAEQRLGDPRLRGRAGPDARRAPAQAVAAPGRRRHAPLVRLCGDRRRAHCATPTCRRTGRSARAGGSSRAISTDGRRDAAAAGRRRDRAPARGVRAREGGVRAALRARQPPRLGGNPGRGYRAADARAPRRRCDGRARGEPPRRARRPRGRGRRRRRAHAPARSGRRAGPARRRRGRAQESGRALGGAAAEGATAARVRARGRVPGRQHVHRPRPVLVPADARRARSPPRHGRPPRAALRAARRARP